MVQQPPARRQFVSGSVSCVNCRDIFRIHSQCFIGASWVSLITLSFLIALGRLSFVGDAFWKESQGLSTPQWPKIVLTTQRLLEDSSYWSKTTAQTLGVNKRLTSSLFFSNLHFFSIWSSCWTSWTWGAGKSRPTRQRYTRFARCTGLLNENFLVEVLTLFLRCRQQAMSMDSMMEKSMRLLMEVGLNSRRLAPNLPMESIMLQELVVGFLFTT